MNICKLNKDACQASFECEWIVGKGCRPRKGATAVPNASINFTDLPPDVKKLISSKLTGKNAAAFKATNKENRALVPKVTFTKDDYFTLAVKPYAKDLLHSLSRTKGGKTYRTIVMQPDYYNNLINTHVFNAKNKVITEHVNAVDTSKLRKLSKVMEKNADSVERELKLYIKSALDAVPNMRYNNLPERPKDADFKNISSMKELKEFIKNTVINDYYQNYWYARNNKSRI
jgi:hypothetical protein